MSDHRPLTDEERAAIEARVKAATPGPWERWVDHSAIHLGPLKLNDDCGIRGSNGELADFDRGDFSDEQSQANAEFSARARTDIPRLLESEAYWREQAALVSKGIYEMAAEIRKLGQQP